MRIESFTIDNYKSIKDLQLIQPNPFSVFVGPNGAGKSNIFEALEFFALQAKLSDVSYCISLFGGSESILNLNLKLAKQNFILNYPFFAFGFEITHFIRENGNFSHYINGPSLIRNSHYKGDENIGNVKNFVEFNRELNLFPLGLSRIFLNNLTTKRFNSSDHKTLNADGSNLEQVLNRLLKNKEKKDEIIEWLQILIPEFRNIEIEVSNLSGEAYYVIYEKGSSKPFPKHLISDGTKNILALLTAVYQSDEPQFLCIEEPENGLHPHVIERLVSLFRQACEEKGHYIWLNSHSQTLVRQLTADEIIVVEKKNGFTQVKQFRGKDYYGLKMDDAWLTNALGGGLP